MAETSGMAALYAAVDMHTLAETVGRPNPKPHDTLDSPDIVKALLATRCTAERDARDPDRYGPRPQRWEQRRRPRRWGDAADAGR